MPYSNSLYILNGQSSPDIDNAWGMAKITGAGN